MPPVRSAYRGHVRPNLLSPCMRSEVHVLPCFAHSSRRSPNTPDAITYCHQMRNDIPYDLAIWIQVANDRIDPIVRFTDWSVCIVQLCATPPHPNTQFRRIHLLRTIRVSLQTHTHSPAWHRLYCWWHDSQPHRQPHRMTRRHHQANMEHLCHAYWILPPAHHDVLQFTHRLWNWTDRDTTRAAQATALPAHASDGVLAISAGR